MSRDTNSLVIAKVCPIVVHIYCIHWDIHVTVFIGLGLGLGWV